LRSSLNYERHGSGEPVVLLHGIGGELCVWEPVLEPLAAAREVIAVDLPGFGRSPALAGEPTPAALARAVAEFTGSLGFERFHVVGNSLGGWVALELARLGHARSVVGLCPAGLWSPPAHPERIVTRGRAHRLIRGLGPVLAVALLSARVRAAALGPFVAHPERIPYRSAWRMISSYGRATAYDATNTAMRRGHFSDPEEIDVPVLLAFGERDRLIRPRRISAPGYRTVMLPDCGHIPMWDDPGLIARLILGHTAVPSRSDVGANA
jgi:pimeloyl-ACP methyl ester carboxylesterase